MRNRELSRQLQVLDGLFQRTSLACGDDIEMLAHWARYLCVLAAGFIENALTEIYSDFVGRAASEPVARYARSVLSKIQNPNSARLCETTYAFKGIWGEQLELYLNDDGRREAIDSIMNTRHAIAHGKNTGITLARLRDYFKRAVAVMEYIEDQCNR
jgi:hypothetical protein